MKKIALFAAVSSFALALAACGDTDDASEDAMADNVEMPADEAMAGGGLALQRDEQVARPDLSRVEGDSGDGEVRRSRAAGRLGDFG